MVRLKEIAEIDDVLTYQKFQFLHGAIKRKYWREAGLHCILFQFLHGAIKSASFTATSLTAFSISIPTWCD